MNNKSNFQRPRLARGVLTAVMLAAALTTSARGQAVVVSNLEQASDFGRYFGHDDATPTSIGTSFTTGSDGAAISGLTLAFVAASGSPTTLTVSLYSGFTPNVGPSGLIQTFASTQNPTSAGLYDFIGGATLAPSTKYYVIATDSTVGGGLFSSYGWRATQSAAEDPGGFVGATIANDYILNYGLLFNWSVYSGSGALQLSVNNAAAVPEPSTYALLAGGVALAGAVMIRRRGVVRRTAISAR